MTERISVDELNEYLKTGRLPDRIEMFDQRCQMDPPVDPPRVPPPSDANSVGRKRMGVDWLKGEPLLRVVIRVPVLTANRLYATQMKPAGHAVPHSATTEKVVYRKLKSGLFLPVRPFRVKTREHDAWRSEIQKQLADLGIHQGCAQETGELYMRIWVHSAKWYTKRKTIRERDLANAEKAFIDAVFAWMGLKDSHVFVSHMEKVDDRSEAFTFELGTLDRG